MSTILFITVGGSPSPIITAIQTIASSSSVPTDHGAAFPKSWVKACLAKFAEELR